MKHKKTVGFVHCIVTSFDDNFIEAVNSVSGQPVTFVLKFKMTDKLRECMTRAIEEAKIIPVLAKKIDAEFYQYIKLSHGQHMGIRRSMQQQIAYENLMKEVEKDWNPVHTGTIRQSLIHGRGGLPIKKRLNGKIGTSLLKNVAVSKSKSAFQSELEDIGL